MAQLHISTTGEVRSDRAMVTVAIRASVADASGKSKLHGWVRNVSIGGMYMDTGGNQFPVDHLVDIDLLVSEQGMVYRFQARARVAHTYEGGMGFQFMDLDRENLTLVERLVHKFKG